MVVMKFGGTSVGNAQRLARMVELVVQTSGKPGGQVAIVVSAMGGTTDVLLDAGRAAAAGEAEQVAEMVAQIGARHLAVAREPEVVQVVSELLERLRSLLAGMRLLQEQTPRSRALLASFGERLSAPLAAQALREAGVPAEAVDARAFVRTDDTWEEGRVDLDATRKLGREKLLPLVEAGRVPVVTGFLGATAEGVTTVLGRSGSDYSAALLGHVLDATEVVIWTDVDGILTADPRVVSEARSLPRVSYAEAAEMSYFGAKVIHPKTMLPCERRGIPIRIRSTFDPELPGTLVGPETGPSPLGVKVVTAMRELSLITVEGRGMAGVPGVSRRIFEVADAAAVNVLMISQASSEQTVSVVVRTDDAKRLHDGLLERLRLELDAGLLGAVHRRDGVTAVSVLGAGMAGTPGTAGRLFTALGHAGVNVAAIAQGGGELSISVVVDGVETDAAVRAVHTAFGLTRTVHLVVVGLGRVAESFLEMLEENAERFLASGHVYRVVAGVRSRTWAFDPSGIAPSALAEQVAAGPERPSDEALVQQVGAVGLTDVVWIDLSAAPLADLHRMVLECHMHVVTANKVPLSGPRAEHDALWAARDASHVRYGYETTFGAGLPVLHTLQELLATGDELRMVQGCFSGTLGFLCTRLDEGVTLQDAVEEARSLGYTEPDPRDDLSGMDVARKALIVARSIGTAIEPFEVVREPFVDGLEDGLEAALASRGPALEARWAAARERGATLRYVASIEGGDVAVGLREVPLASPLGSLSGPDNMLVFTTRRYHDNPLVIRGPGAGAEVTAAGVLGDLLRVQ